MFTSKDKTEYAVVEIIKIHNIYLKKVDPHIHIKLSKSQIMLNGIIEWVTKLKHLQEKKFRHMNREQFCAYYISKNQDTRLLRLKRPRSFELYYNIHNYHQEGLSHVLQTLIDHNKNEVTHSGPNGLVDFWRDFKQWYCNVNKIPKNRKTTLNIPPLQDHQILNYIKHRKTKTINTAIITSFVDLPHKQHNLVYDDIKKYKDDFYLNKSIKKWKKKRQTTLSKKPGIQKSFNMKPTSTPTLLNKSKPNRLHKEDCYPTPRKKQKLNTMEINKIQSKQKLTTSNIQNQYSRYDNKQRKLYSSMKLLPTSHTQQISTKQQNMPYGIEISWHNINTSKDERYLQKIKVSNNYITNYRKDNNIHISYDNGQALFDPYNVYAIVADLKWILDMIMGFKVDEFSLKKINIPKNSLVMFHRKKEKLTLSDLQQYINSRLDVILINDVKRLCSIYARIKQKNHDSSQCMKTYNNEALCKYLKPLKLHNISFKNLSKCVNTSTFKHIFGQIIKMINDQQISLIACRIYLGMTEKIEKFEHHVNYQFLCAEQKRKANYFTNKYKNSFVYHFSLETYYFSEWERQFLELTTSPSYSGLFATFPKHNTLSIQQNQKYTAFVLKWPKLRSEIIYGDQTKLTNDMKHTRYPKQLSSLWQCKWKQKHNS